jgi:hypothetical protein
MALLWSFPSPHQMPAPHCVFAFPLFLQAPSVYIVVRSFVSSIPWALCWRVTGVLDHFCGSTKILNPSARLSFVVIEGLKVIMPLVHCASLFFCFLLLVRDRSSMLFWIAG